MTDSMNDSFRQKVRVINPISGAPRRPAGQCYGSGGFQRDSCSRRAFPAAVGDLDFRCHLDALNMIIFGSGSHP